MRIIRRMRKTTLFFLLVLIASSAPAAASRQRIINRPTGPQATLSGQTRDAVTDATAVSIEVEGPRRYATTDAEGKFTMQIPVGLPVTLTFHRAGYETLTETVTITGNESRVFRLTPLPTARITRLSGVSHAVAADTVEFGWMVPFSGYRRHRSALMCRPGGGEFILDRSEIDRVEGPALTVMDAACCPDKLVRGAVFELATGEKITAYFMDTCDAATMEVIARDQTTYEMIFVPLSELVEVVFPGSD